MAPQDMRSRAPGVDGGNAAPRRVYSECGKESTTLGSPGQTSSSPRRRARLRRRIVIGAALVAVATVVVLKVVGDAGQHRDPPALQMLRGPHGQVEARLRPIARTIAARVERIRGLQFDHRPRVVVMSEGHLAKVGAQIARHERHRARLHPTRLRASRRLEHASVELDQLAGLLPAESGFGPDTRTTGLDRIGGAFDFPRDRIIIVPGLIETHAQLYYTLAHEMTHALEDQHFKLHLARLTAPSESAEVHRAVIEGTATFVQDLYRHRYMHDNVPVGTRIDSMRSVIGAQQTPYAVNAEAIFDYVEGGLFVRQLYRRTHDFSIVNRVLRRPPSRSDQILHPRAWPDRGHSGTRVRLGIGGRLGARWRLVGTGIAGEERALAILLAGAFGTQANSGASGWAGGTFAVWRPRTPKNGCEADCVDGNIGVIAFRWHHHADAEQFAIGVPAYMTLGLLAGNITPGRLWQVSDGYAALGTAKRASALVFAPRPKLALRLSRKAAAAAQRSAR